MRSIVDPNRFLRGKDPAEEVTVGEMREILTSMSAVELLVRPNLRDTERRVIKVEQRLWDLAYDVNAGFETICSKMDSLSVGDLQVRLADMAKRVPPGATTDEYEAPFNDAQHFEVEEDDGDISGIEIMVFDTGNSTALPKFELGMMAPEDFASQVRDWIV
jgi:hypothetical protein